MHDRLSASPTTAAAIHPGTQLDQQRAPEMYTAALFAPVHFLALTVLPHMFPGPIPSCHDQVLRATTTGKRITCMRRFTNGVRNRPALRQAGNRILQ